jgi:hypothetical protein
MLYKDLADYGVFVIPPGDPKYQALVADIQRQHGGSRFVHDADSFEILRDRRAAVGLLNGADQAIASIACIWHVRLQDDRVVQRRFQPGTNPSVLLPFGLTERSKKFHRYWNCVFPGSKRLINFRGTVMGDNTDVRPPEPDELSEGGTFWLGPGSRPQRGEDPVKFVLDGVFFEDGSFAGPNELGSWEQTVTAAEMCRELGELARAVETRQSGSSEFFEQVRVLTGQPEAEGYPPPPPPSLAGRGEILREHERRVAGWRVQNMRQRMADDEVIAQVAGWANIVLPPFRKL